mmetsp:Transcript_3836/g.3915  ORF Transcript_3836/g.3915 Transcript_3836/m.3915 type:complete len:466 (-) Transcript_3836:47-1444(-)
MFVDFFYKVTNLIEGKKPKEFSVNSKKLKELKLLGEGGYGYVYLVEDLNKEKLALKLMNIPDEQTMTRIKSEINTWRTLTSQNPNIIKLIDHEIETVKQTKDSTNIAVAKCLMEFSSEGTLLDYLNKSPPLSEKEALSIVKEICLFLQDLHSCNPPVAHRDIKPENILKFRHKYKICDFGSCSSQTLNYKTASKKEINKQHEEFERHSTFCYRPPEMVDKFCQYEVNTKVDIWMLGCTLFTMAYKKHPFEKAQKLTIINCSYNFPSRGELYSEKFQDLIRMMLNPNPENRPGVNFVLDIVSNWDLIKKMDLPYEVLEVKSRQTGVKIVKRKRGSSDNMESTQGRASKKSDIFYSGDKDDGNLSTMSTVNCKGTENSISNTNTRNTKEIGHSKGDIEWEDFDFEDESKEEDCRDSSVSNVHKEINTNEPQAMKNTIITKEEEELTKEEVEKIKSEINDEFLEVEEN